MTPNRATDGRFSTHAAPPVPLADALDTYNRFLAAVCRHQSLQLRDVNMQLARTGENNLDPAWRKASYARQLAMYLTNTLCNVQQVTIARIAGVTPAAVCLALREIEDLRDHRDYDKLIEKITLETKAKMIGECAP